MEHKPELEATIALLKQHFEDVRKKEINRVCGRLGGLTNVQKDVIESLTHRLVDQILETPITVLKAFEKNHSVQVIDALHRVFSLGVGADRRLPPDQR